jgi:uncharacterized Zn-binding protein involved in type VI secretion
MKNVIRLGDPTSHGGKVADVTAKHFTVGGIAVACVGDKCLCPIKGHDNCTIAEGNAHHIINGVAVAYDGHKTTCGATLISTVDNFSSN